MAPRGGKPQVLQRGSSRRPAERGGHHGAQRLDHDALLVLACRGERRATLHFGLGGAGGAGVTGTERTQRMSLRECSAGRSVTDQYGGRDVARPVGTGAQRGAHRRPRQAARRRASPPRARCCTPCVTCARSPASSSKRRRRRTRTAARPPQGRRRRGCAAPARRRPAPARISAAHGPRAVGRGGGCCVGELRAALPAAC